MTNRLIMIKSKTMVLYIISFFFIPLIVIPIVYSRIKKQQEKVFREHLRAIQFNNYIEIEVMESLTKRNYLFFNDDGRVLIFNNYNSNFVFDIRDYEFIIFDPENKNEEHMFYNGDIYLRTSSKINKPYEISFIKKNTLKYDFVFKIYESDYKQLYPFIKFYKENGYI